MMFPAMLNICSEHTSVHRNFRNARVKSTKSDDCCPLSGIYNEIFLKASKRLHYVKEKCSVTGVEAFIV